MRELVWLVPALPLAGLIINGIIGKPLMRKNEGLVGTLASALVGGSFLISLLIFLEMLSLPAGERGFEKILYTWIQSESFKVVIGFQVDQLSGLMILVVSGVGFVIHLYSMGYMHKDPGYYRYFSYLNLFTFSMLILVLANNFLLMFVGWEAVGLSSYLLIGFWFERKSAADAGKKAFIVNRVGDFGFLLGMLLIVTTFGTLDFSGVFAAAPDKLTSGGLLVTVITLLLFAGAIGKSAQIPLYVWLPDAMEGPTPVSALIHAATMVTAGVYMVARASSLFVLAPFTLGLIAVIGAGTALFAATIGMVQNDIKRVLAYSTISQLGYMFLAAGVAAFSASIFHLITHAFFKALLFLAAGSVIHSLHNQMDMRNMGGLKSKLPLTFAAFLIGALAIAGIPGLSGFFSKDEIIWQSYVSPFGGPVLWFVATLTAGLTAFYMFRVVFMTFFGSMRVKQEVRPKIHESPKVMAIPLVILAFLSIIGGYVGVPKLLGGSGKIFEFLAPVFPEAVAEVHGGMTEEGILMGISVIVSLLGILSAYLMYVYDPSLPERMAQGARRTYNVLSQKYYVDEFYDAVLVQPIKRLSLFLWSVFDSLGIDGMVNGVASVVAGGSARLRKLQTGFVQNYALGLLLGVIIILGYLVLR
ncbi:MAG: NADH-quinone oxidoreductase subunit L [Thermodesulfobacteriota bacterium]